MRPRCASRNRSCAGKSPLAGGRCVALAPTTGLTEKQELPTFEEATRRVEIGRVRAGRVARPGAPVVIQVWGRPERCALSGLRPAAAPFVAQPGPSSARAQPPLWKPGVLERVAAGAGLEPVSEFDHRWAFHCPDDQTLARAMLAAGGLADRAGPEQAPALRAAILEALAPHRTGEGANRLENEWHYLARA
jgi:hypothetical protein